MGDTYTVVFHKRGNAQAIEATHKFQRLEQVDEWLADSAAPCVSRSQLLETGKSKIWDYTWGNEWGVDINVGFIIKED